MDLCPKQFNASIFTIMGVHYSTSVHVHVVTLLPEQIYIFCWHVHVWNTFTRRVDCSECSVDFWNTTILCTCYFAFIMSDSIIWSFHSEIVFQFTFLAIHTLHLLLNCIMPQTNEEETVSLVPNECVRLTHVAVN